MTPVQVDILSINQQWTNDKREHLSGDHKHLYQLTVGREIIISMYCYYCWYSTNSNRLPQVLKVSCIQIQYKRDKI